MELLNAVGLVPFQNIERFSRNIPETRLFGDPLGMAFRYAS